MVEQRGIATAKVMARGMEPVQKLQSTPQNTSMMMVNMVDMKVMSSKIRNNSKKNELRKL